MAAPMAALRSARIVTPLPLAAGAEGSTVQTGSIPLPERLLILPWGENRALDGSPIVVNETTAQVLAANQAKIGAGEVPLDFEHNTVEFDEKGKRKKTTEPKPVAGYGTLSVVPGEGIYYTPVSWTDEGQKFYTGGHYRDLSATPLPEKGTGVVLAIDSVALCRKGQIEGVHAFSAARLVTLSALLCPESESETETTMDPYKAALLKLLKLPETATDEEIAAAQTAAEKGVDKPAETPGTPTPLSAEARLDQIERRQVEGERRQILDGAKAAGKIIPLSADAINALPLDTLRTVVDGLTPGQVPITATTPGAGADSAPALKALSADELTACRLLGVDPKRYRELNPA
jgi:phage I-like protein